MKERERDELADALSRMSSGQETPAQDETIEAPKGSADGAAEAVPPRTAPLFRSAGAATPAPVSRVRPSAPGVRPAVPNITPPTTAHEPTLRTPSSPTSAAGKRRVAPPPLYRRLEFRRTLIPILLTLGVMLPGLGAMPFIVGADSPLAAVPSGAAITFIITGLALLSLAAVNMIQVKHELSRSRSASPS